MNYLLKTAEAKHAFEKFSEEDVAHLTAAIDSVTKGYKLIASKRESLWAQFHQLRVDEKGKLHMLWKELLHQLKVVDDDSLLKQSV